MTRADSRLIKKIARDVPHWVENWQSAPFFSSIKEISLHYCGDLEMLKFTPGGKHKPLPYDDFVFCVENMGIESNINMFVRVVSPKNYYDLNFSKVFLDQALPGITKSRVNESFACAYCMIEDKVMEPIVLGFNGNGYSSSSPTWYLGRLDQKTLDDISQIAGSAVNNFVSYLMQSPKHILEQRNASPAISPKTAKLKPWLRDDLPTLVLMDPNDARAAGQPREVADDGDNEPRIGRHKRPHSRRAHWRRLGVADDGTIRKTFVRSCWIGPDEWMYEGRQYRVLKPAVNGD